MSIPCRLRYCRCLDTAVIVFPTCASNKFVSAEERTKSFLRVCTEAGIQESPVQGQTADSVDGGSRDKQLIVLMMGLGISSW